jgi:hypothetical protein
MDTIDQIDTILAAQPSSWEDVNAKLQALRSNSCCGTLGASTVFGAGVQLNSDTSLQLQGEFRSPPGWLLELKMRPDGRGAWCGLHLDLPPFDVSADSIFGFTARGAASHKAVVSACLRSGRGQSFSDAFFDRHLMLRPEEIAHTDALQARIGLEIPAQADWRQLVLFLPCEAIRLSLIDLRIFML